VTVFDKVLCYDCVVYETKYGHDRRNGGLFRHGDEEKSVKGGSLMCVGQQFKTYSVAINYLGEARESLIKYQYQKCLDKLEQAEKEIQNQKVSLKKYLQKELENKKNSFQKTPENIAKLEKLNDHLRVIEHETDAEAKKIKQALQARLREQKDFLTDYELQIDLVFYLREDDPEYSEDEDSILATLDCCDCIGFGDADENYDHNTAGGVLPFEHCALFHALYDHITPALHWSDLLRIGSVWVEIKVEYQKKYGLETGELRRDNWIDPDEIFHYRLRE
jgi:hypothetical protein